MSGYRALLVSKDKDSIQAGFENREYIPLETGHVRIQVRYSSLNYKDALAVTGKGKIMRRFPLVAGIDAAGEIVESSDSRFNAGQAVLVTGYGLSQTHHGAYAEYLQVPADWVVPLPPGLSLFEAMALGTAGFTAGLAIWRMLDNHQSADMGSILVSGATGGVASIAISCLAALGFNVTALTGKFATSADYLNMLGAAEVLERQQLVFGDKPLESIQWGGAIDTVGGSVLAWLTRTVAQQGNIASCGMAAGMELDATVMPFILRGVSILGVNSATCPMALRLQVWQRLSTDMKPTQLEKMVTEVIGLVDIINRAELMLAGKTQGRYVIDLAK